MKTYEFEGAKYEETGVWGPPQTGEVFLADMSCFLTSGRAMRACYNYCASRRILRPVEEGFKVGDRVKSKLNGAEAEILEVRGKKMVLRFDDNSSGLWHGRDCFTPVIPTPDTVTIGSTTYRKLKSLSPISVIRSVNDSICPAIKQGIEDYADRFNSLYSEPNLTDVLDWCKTGPKRLGWAIKEGYIDSGAAPAKDTRWKDVAQLKPQTTTKEEVAARRKRHLLWVIPAGTVKAPKPKAKTAAVVDRPPAKPAEKPAETAAATGK